MVNKPMAGTFWTGLPGMDDVILPGGSPLRSLNVIGGAPGTGKTVLALQMLFANATPENRALYFTTVSEPTVKFLGFLQDFDFYEIHEAFAAQVLANGKALDWDWDRVNVRGGAIALGHPLGASGARILVSLIHSLRQSDLEKGLAVICHAGGGAVAISVEAI